MPCYVGKLTAVRRSVAFESIRYDVPAGQTKVPNPNMTIMAVKKNVPWLWGEKKKVIIKFHMSLRTQILLCEICNTIKTKTKHSYDLRESNFT